MHYDLIHIVPFDIGLNLTLVDSPKKYQPDRFLQDVEAYAIANNCAMERRSDFCLCSITLSDNIKCLIYSVGIGVFVAKKPQQGMTQQGLASNPLEKHISCNAYYDKKITESHISSSTTGLSDETYNFMKKLYKIRNKSPEPIRPFSSTFDYKDNGLSYALTIYHLCSLTQNEDENREIDALLNPAVLSEILDETKWNEISQRLEGYAPAGFSSFEFSATSRVAATWAAVAILEEGTGNQKLVDTIVEYEAMLQCGWFFFDVTRDNLEKRVLSGVELQKLKNMAVEIDHKISCSVSANMTTRMKNITKMIRNTSGYEDIRDSCMLLLENRIDLEQAKHEERRSLYGSLTEILLVVIALFQIYEPIKHLISDQVTRGDITVFFILLIVLILSIVFIVRRDR